MSYLGDIVAYIRTTSSISFKDNVYLGNDINAIDTAYSESDNHKLSAFFVPADVQNTYGEYADLIQTHYFNAYIFVPVGDDIGATDGWELAIGAAQDLNLWVQATTVGVNKVKCLSEREFRVGRGYYIYVVSYSVDTRMTSGFAGGQAITYYKYTGEIDGTATYSSKILTHCKVDENFALSRTVNGIYRSFGCQVLLGPLLSSQRIDPTYKDWFIVYATYDNLSKAEAIARGYRVYEVNEWKKYYGEIDDAYLGMKIIGV